MPTTRYHYALETRYSGPICADQKWRIFATRDRATRDRFASTVPCVVAVDRRTAAAYLGRIMGGTQTDGLDALRHCHDEGREMAERCDDADALSRVCA
jgi:hypothetical protein